MLKETEQTKWKMLEMRAVARGQQARAAKLQEDESYSDRGRDSEVWRGEVTTSH